MASLTLSTAFTSRSSTHKGPTSPYPLELEYTQSKTPKYFWPKKPKHAQNITMDHQLESYFGFVDGASQWSQNLAAATWVIYYPNWLLLCSNGVCIGSGTNNKSEYDVVIGLMCEALHQGIHHMHVYLDSELVVSQLNQTFETRDASLLRKYLHAKGLSRQFGYITLSHVSKNQNQTTDRIDNNILDWNASRTNHHT